MRSRIEREVEDDGLKRPFTDDPVSSDCKIASHCITSPGIRGDADLGCCFAEEVLKLPSPVLVVLEKPLRVPLVGTE